MNQDQLQALLDRQINSGKVFNIAAGVQSRDGRVNVSAAAGRADAASGAAMTPQTPYALASIAKMYTAAVIMRLHEQGRLSLDANVAHYLPAALLTGIHVYKGTDYSAQLRVYQLVNQTSGLADYFEGKPAGGQSLFETLKQGQDRGINTQQIVELVRTLPPRFAPGAGGGRKAFYSDTNYHLLGVLIETVTGKTLAENFEQLIFAPLGLEHSFVYDPAAPRFQRPADLFLQGQVLHAPQFFAAHIADGGVFATVQDSLRFLHGFFDGRLFDAHLLERMTQRWNSIFFPMQYGYGMMRINLPRLFSPFRPFPDMIGHSGSTGSFAYYNRAHGIAVAGTINQIAAPGRAVQLALRLAMLAGA